MIKGKFILIFIALFLFVSSHVHAQNQDTREYVVVKGDTLWDISQKELNDFFLWPKIWQENPDIKNPDRIYPGQKIRIPLFTAQEEAPPPPPPPPVKVEPMAEEPQKPVIPPPLIPKKPFMSAGYISDSVDFQGKIVGSPSGRNLFGDNDIFYVETKTPVNIGDKFFIIAATKMITHPATGKKLGYLVAVLGIAEILRFEYGETLAKITHSFSAIQTGQMLDTYFDMSPPLKQSSYRKPEIEGYIVASRKLNINTAYNDIVYIDKGSNDGLQPGDVLRVVEVRNNIVGNRPHKVPVGVVQVISVRGNFSAAIVTNNEDVVAIGNMVTKFEK